MDELAGDKFVFERDELAHDGRFTTQVGDQIKSPDINHIMNTS